MSLRYIIDGYNIINHPSFAKTRKKSADPRFALLDLIRSSKLCGSLKNKVTCVFDGYPPSGLRLGDTGIDAIFSCDDSADERIKSIVSRSENPKIITVVTDDNEVRFFARSCGAQILGAGEFLGRGEKAQRARQDAADSARPEITYSDMSRITKELENKWLKKK